MTFWGAVDHTLSRVSPGTALAAFAACFFAYLFYRISTRAIESLQKENQRLVEEKKLLYSKLGLTLENSGLDHYNKNADKLGKKKRERVP